MSETTSTFQCYRSKRVRGYYVNVTNKTEVKPWDAFTIVLPVCSKSRYWVTA